MRSGSPVVHNQSLAPATNHSKGERLDRLRVLHVIQTVAQSDGGTSAAVLGMCQSVAAAGVDAEIYATRDGSADYARVPFFEKTIINDVQATFFPVQGTKRRFRFSYQFAQRLNRDARRFDLLHIHSLYNFLTLSSARIAARLGIPYIIQPHGSLDPYHYRQRRWLKAPYEAFFDRPVFARASAVLFTSEEEMRLANQTGWRFRGVVAPLGVELSAYESESCESETNLWPQCRSKRTLLFLGRVAEKKGLDILIPAFANLLRSRSDLHLLIAGPENDTYGNKVRSWVCAYNLSDSVTFAGMLTGEAKRSAFASATVFVLPSRSENFGFAVVEAMAAGLPVVLSEHVNIGRQIADSDAGLIVPLKTGQLEAAIGSLLDNPLLSESIGRNAKALAQSEFSWPSSW
jgi:glycosyltransferase involved in cell wall biosynthesis